MYHTAKIDGMPHYSRSFNISTNGCFKFYMVL